MVDGEPPRDGMLCRDLRDAADELDRLNAKCDALEKLADLRSAGWSVAVHNDYRLNGAAMTFWLLTHPAGLWVKGEGATDAAALEACAEQARKVFAPSP
jgi:hypothetical protein